MIPLVPESWARIETWLARHAPRTFAALEPPAERSDIAVAEQIIGQPFPEPLVQSLLRHNGTGDDVLLPPYWRLLNTHIIASDWQLGMRIYHDVFEGVEESDFGDDWGPWWHSRWIPFATSGGGDTLVVDQRPYRRRGRIGEADHEQGTRFSSHPMWSSLPALMDATATALETGQAVDGCLPVVADGTELSWEIL
ncbi:SMI1/KNR4 family protein [Streptomyces venezuelae]|uniref:SMI1/KNR4 family protein n=1 Tax=Streptomyces venezuelae TaxID=54571 RepID=A0A5P2BSC7_STRVZ|nr:SMI1/KNR4 family protein [Streptomyces venezuelae]QES33374.1 SMI1/KNR4 family protein [Streptomyces venezuelae]